LAHDFINQQLKELSLYVNSSFCRLLLLLLLLLR
jgi:hypothetical protein